MKNRTSILGAAAAVVIATSAWLLLPNAAPDAAPPPAAVQTARTPGQVPLSGAQIKALGIELAMVEPAQTITLATLPAQIAPPPNARVAVAAQLPGVITRIFVVNGQIVARGQALATVASRDVIGLSADLARAQSRRAVASAQASRLRQLADEGVIAPSRSDEASALARQSSIDVSEQNRLIALLGGGRGKGASYTLSSPIAGRISGMTAEAGKMVDSAMAPFVIDGAGPLQVTAQVPERLIGSVRAGMRVRVGADAVGTVLAVGTTIDPMTRSATLTATLPPAPGIAAGSATSVVIEGPAPPDALRVPSAAVTEIDGRRIVFLVVRGGVAVRPVTIVEGTGNHIVVTSGLARGQRVVVRGISELKTLAGAN